jgi:hypothetical protein
MEPMFWVLFIDILVHQLWHSDGVWLGIPVDYTPRIRRGMSKGESISCRACSLPSPCSVGSIILIDVDNIEYQDAKTILQPNR